MRRSRLDKHSSAEDRDPAAEGPDSSEGGLQPQRRPGKQSMVATHISQKGTMLEDKDMVTKWRQEREICRAITEEYKEEVLELECKLKCKKEELQNLMGNESENMHQRKMLEDKLKSQDPGQSDGEGYKLEDRFKIETWYYLMKEEAMLHILFEKYLESCSFIEHNSTPATVIQLIKNELELIELTDFPTSLIKTGVQRRINRLKKLNEHVIIMVFFRDMICNDYMKKYWDLYSEDLRSHLKAKEEFSYLNDLDDVTFYGAFQEFMFLFPHSFKGDDIEHIVRTLEQSLNEVFDNAYREILKSCEIEEKDVVYYDAFDELEKEFGGSEVYDSARSMISLHRKFDYHLASFSFIKFDIFREENFKDKKLIPEEYSILPRNLIVQSINFWHVMLEKKHELRRCAELVKYLLSEYAKSFDEEQFLSDSKKFSDLPKHIILRGILIRKWILECTGTSKIKVRLSTAYSFCSLMNYHIMTLWERTRYYEDQIYEVPLRLAEKKDLNALNLDVPIWDIFFNKPLPKNGVILMKMSEDGKVTVDVKVVPEENI